jgi:hypothetical protein
MRIDATIGVENGWSLGERIAPVTERIARELLASVRDSRKTSTAAPYR